MLIEGILLIAKLFSGKGLLGSISGATAGTTANVIAKGTIFAKSGFTGEIGSNAIGISTGEGVENSVGRLLKRRSEKNRMHLKKEPTGLQGWLKKRRSEKNRMHLKKEPTGLQGWLKKRRSEKNRMHLKKEPTGLQGWLKKRRSEKNRMHLKKEPTGLQGWLKKIFLRSIMAY